MYRQNHYWIDCAMIDQLQISQMVVSTMWKCFFDVIIWHLLEADKIQSIQRTKVKDFIDIIILIALILWLNYLKKKNPIIGYFDFI